MHLEGLPVELIAEILGELDLKSLVIASQVSRSLHLVASDSSLNPWRQPILANLRSQRYEEVLKHLSVRTTVPRQNWIEILSLARPSFLLYDATLPNLRAMEWEECFHRRFLPGWKRWKKDSPWKEAFLKILHRVWHRSTSSCTSDEAWTKYIVLNRNGSANELEMSSRNFNPIAVFNEIKLQSNLAHLETRVRVLVEFMDVRILVFGTMTKPRSQTSVNENAHLLLNPPSIEPKETLQGLAGTFLLQGNTVVDDHGVYPALLDSASSSPVHPTASYPLSFTRLSRPLPALSFHEYPFFTPSGSDKRWKDLDEINEGGRWIGNMMITAQLVGLDAGDGLSNTRQCVSFGWDDLWTVAPWLEEIITNRIDGPGLGN